MNSIDIFIIIGISLFVVLGYRDGFFKKVFGILGFWAGFILAIKFIDPVSALYVDWFGYSIEVALVFAFFSIFLVTVVVTNLLYRWFGRSTKENLMMRSRIAGALLGGGEGLVAVSLILLMFSLFEMPADDDRRASILYVKMTHIAPRVFDISTQWIPSSQQFFDVIRSKVQKFGPPH